MQRTEIRIIEPQPDVFEAVKKLAKEEKRTIGKQAEYMIIKYLEIIKGKR